MDALDPLRIIKGHVVRQSGEEDRDRSGIGSNLKETGKIEVAMTI